MTQRIESTTGVERVWELLDGQVAAGRMPGYVAAVRIRGRVAVRAAGRTAVGSPTPPMRDDTLFRIASITKPMGGALTLALVRDGVLALDDPVARWLPEAAEPRVLVAPDAPLDRTVPARAAGHRPRPARRHLRLGRVMEPTPLQAAMIERGVFPSPLHRDVTGGRVRRPRREPAAGLPAGRGLALRDRHRPARRAAGAGHRPVAGRRSSPSGSPGRWA